MREVVLGNDSTRNGLGWVVSLGCDLGLQYNKHLMSRSHCKELFVQRVELIMTGIYRLQLLCVC